MRETIAFNNSANHWVSRYSYTASCIGWVKDHMVTAPVSTSSQEVLWKHDQNATTNNSFYGCDSVSSGVALSFNASPSSNKIFKSFSVESPNISKIDGFNTFYTNSVLGQGGFNIGSSIAINRLNQKGGILYGGVDGGGTITNSQVLPLGVVESVVPYEDISSLGGAANNHSAGTGYYKISGPPSRWAGSISTVCKSEDVADVKAGPANPDADVGKIGENQFLCYFYKGGYFVREGNFEVGDELCIVYTTNQRSQARGQFADVSVLFGSSNFEVHALNVDFEPTSLDHNS